MEREHTKEQTVSARGDLSTAIHQPDTLAVSRYVNDRIQRNPSPEKRLMLAVLEDAILCFQEHPAARQGKRKQSFDHVRRWLFDAGDDWVFSFENVCSALLMEPQYIRDGLLRWLKRNSTPLRTLPDRRQSAKPSRRSAIARSMRTPVRSF